MRACRLTLFLVTMIGGAVFIAVEVTALLSPDIQVPQPARLWALALLFLTLETAVGLWAVERFRRFEGVVTTVVLTNTVRQAPPDYGDTNTGRRRPTDADVLNLFSPE